MADLTHDHPYRGLPDQAFWRRAVAGKGPAIDPLGGRFPAIGPADKVATAGSCFAQHIGRHLAANGFNYLVTEPAHPIVPAEIAARHGYGMFTARYGNVYTSLQLLQLFDRAYGHFVPQEDVWIGRVDGVVDPFRPSIEPGGFASVTEMRDDRRQHLEHVREAFETLDIFVFTLGLTETWVSRLDGAAFPLCPGVAAGSFDPGRHGFHNLRVAEVTAQIGAFVQRLRGVNAKARIILTVSPVPLAATAVPDGHVLAATIYSKSVLRAAAQEIAEDWPDVFYFPSYEIITGPQTRGRFFAEDLRTVTEEGVAHVMATFLRHAGGGAPLASVAAEPAEPAEPFVATMQQWVAVMCDEAALDPEDPAASR
jgi:hypothetical protein